MGEGWKEGCCGEVDVQRLVRGKIGYERKEQMKEGIVRRGGDGGDAEEKWDRKRQEKKDEETERTTGSEIQKTKRW